MLGKEAIKQLEELGIYWDEKRKEEKLKPNQCLQCGTPDALRKQFGFIYCIFCPFSAPIV